MLNDYNCQKMDRPVQEQVAVQKPTYEDLKDLDISTSAAKPNPNKAYLEKFFEEKDLPFKQFAINHNLQTNIISTETVIDFLINSLDEATQGKVKDKLIKIDFANADVNHFLEHCAKGIILLREAQLVITEPGIDNSLDSTAENTNKTADASVNSLADSSSEISPDKALDDDNDFSI